jgi:hypothetical protein
MKKTIVVMLLLVLTGCSTANQATTEPEPTTVIVVEEPTQTPLPTEEPTQPPEPTLDPNDVENILTQWLINAQEVFSEDPQAMSQNEGGQFGPVPIKTYNSSDSVFEFSTGEGEAGWVPLNTLLDEYGSDRQPGSPQAILFKFQAPNQPDQLIFDFMGPNEFGIDFQDGGKPSLFWFIDVQKEAFTGDLVLQTGAVYNVLMAIDSEGNFRSVVWEEGNYQNQATFSDNFAERENNGAGYQNQSWKFVIGFGSSDTLKIHGYRVFTFEGFAS